MPLHVSGTICSSSEGQNCIIHHLVSSQSVGGRPERRLREDSLNLRILFIFYDVSSQLLSTIVDVADEMKTKPQYRFACLANARTLCGHVSLLVGYEGNLLLCVL